MSVHIHLPLEHSATSVTWESSSAMAVERLEVTPQCSPSRKLLLAIVTFIVLYSQVHVYVASQVGFAVKSTVAVVASKAALIVPAM